jgi:hypothetical protein
VLNNITDPTFRARLAVLAQGLTIAFTSSREEPDANQRAHIHTVLETLGAARAFATGGCIGGDHYIGETLLAMYPGRRHTVIVPADRSRVAAWWRSYPDHPGLNVIEMPPNTQYRDRNLGLIQGYATFLGSQLLLGFPAHNESHRKSGRSGSWQTIRMGRRSHLHQPIVMPLEAM